jgi:hypothetical protein
MIHAANKVTELHVTWVEVVANHQRPLVVERSGGTERFK